MKNVICVHCKEVYKDRPKKCPECGGQTFEYTLAEVKKQNVGTITWIKCDQLPPTFTKTDLGHYSKKVLVTDGYSISQSELVRTVNETPVGWLGKNIFGFIPTHWAHINFPE